MTTARQHALASIRALLADMASGTDEWDALAHAEYQLMSAIGDTRMQGTRDVYFELRLHASMPAWERPTDCQKITDDALRECIGRVEQRMYWSNGAKQWRDSYMRLSVCYAQRQIAHACSGYMI